MARYQLLDDAGAPVKTGGRYQMLDDNKPVMQNLGSPEESMRAELASRPMWERGLAGIGTFVDDAAMRAKQLFGNNLTPQEEANVRDNRTIASDPAGMAGNIAGSVLATGYPGAALYRGAAGVASRVLPRVLAPTVGGAVTGATIGATTRPVLDGESTGENAAYGAAGGALGDTGARVLSRVARPIMQSPAVQRILGQGIVPTPGQAAGGVLSRIEQQAESLPGPGYFITAGRNRAQQEFNRAALNRAVPAGEAPVTQIGQHGIEEAAQGISNSYDRALGGKTMQPDIHLAAAVDAAKKVPTLPLNEVRQDQYDKIMDKVLWQRIPANGELPAEAVKAEIDRDLGQLAFNLSGRSKPAEEQALGESIRAARDAVRNWMTRQTGNSADRVAADAAHSNKAAVQKAVDKAKTQGGQFTPFQLQNSARRGTPIRALANDAQEVLGNRVPDSGTAGRVALAHILGVGGLGGAYANEHLGGPGYVTALALAPLTYSRAGSRYMAGNLPGQQAIADLIRSGAMPASQASIAGLLDWKGR